MAGSCELDYEPWSPYRRNARYLLECDGDVWINTQRMCLLTRNQTLKAASDVLRHRYEK